MPADPPEDQSVGARRRRSDAAQNFARIVSAAVTVFRADPDASMDRVAEAADVGRATVYRHFPRRSDLVDAAAQQARDDSESNERDRLRPAGELGGTVPTTIDVVDVLNKVPPHLLGDQLVAEARRLAGVDAVALYVVDIDGSRLLRLSGSDEFPAELPVALGVGPELPRSAIAGLRHLVGGHLPDAVVVPMYLRGRAVAVLLVDGQEDTLRDLARQGAAALQLGEHYTDVFAMAARRRRISPASEIQQNLLPPRIARISGATLAGNVLPSYDVGGDWFDYVENADGAWLGIADAVGNGPAAAGLAAILLGAFRAGRRNETDLVATVDLMHNTLVGLGGRDLTATAIVARWHAPSATFSWINRAHPAPLLISADGRAEVLDEPTGEILGSTESAVSPPVAHRRLHPEDRIVLYSNGISDRLDTGGRAFGSDGIIAAARTAANLTAASTVTAIEQAVLGASPEPLKDDATLVVLAPTARVDAVLPEAPSPGGRSI